jgi:hypothetical protein
MTTSEMTRRAALAREVRLLVAPALGSWTKVLQLVLLMLTFAVVVAIVSAAAGEAWPMTWLNWIPHAGHERGTP